MDILRRIQNLKKSSTCDSIVSNIKWKIFSNFVFFSECPNFTFRYCQEFMLFWQEFFSCDFFCLWKSFWLWFVKVVTSSKNLGTFWNSFSNLVTIQILLCIFPVGIYFNLFSSPLIFMILCQHSFFLLNRFECKIVQCILIVDSAWAQKTLIVAGVPWRTSARFGVTVEMQHRIPCIGSHTNQDAAPQSLQCSPMNCSEPLPGIIYPPFCPHNTVYIY